MRQMTASWGTPASLRQGIGLDIGDMRLWDLPGRITLSNGTCRTSSLKGDHVPGSFIPRSPWREPTVLELALLTGGADAEPGARVQLACVPENALATLRELEIQGPLNRVELARLRRTRRYHASLRAFDNELTEWALTRDSAAVGGIFCNPPGLDTTTFDAPTGGYVGLHVDTFYGASINRAHEAPGRLCANVGTQPREFLFINLSLRQLAESVGQRLSDCDITTTELAQKFLSRFSEYPVVRVRIAPGEAYIAPTENIIHDGSTSGMTAEDKQLMLRGFFDIRLEAKLA